MEPLAVPGTPEAEAFTDAQGFIIHYACEPGLSAAECSPTHFDDSLELLGGFRDLECWSDNIDHCISYLNKELGALGLPALFNDAGSEDGLEHGFDLLALVNGTCRLLNLYRGVSAKLNDMEVEDLQRARELDYLRTRQGKLKNQVEACEREIAAVQSKEQQLQNCNKRLNSMLKEEKDEITKLLSALASQKTEHTHEMKKKEQELFRMKEKMSQLVTDKRDRRGSIDILNVLPRADGKRTTWKTGKSLGRLGTYLFSIAKSYNIDQERLASDDLPA
ncbi:Afadin- and alpha-actinin-binding protein [Varanus komodoensis]|nr:Afadin- and alpha-actinin-binding protein [Varanus komodoensis]